MMSKIKQDDQCRQCKGGETARACKLCKGSGKARVTLCLRCDQPMVMDGLYNKICPNCRCRPSEVREPYKVNFGR